MKKFGFLIFVVVLVIGFIAASASSFGRLNTGGMFHFNFGGVKGSGNVVTQARDLSDFHAVEVSNAIQVEITAQKDFAIEVQADDNIAPLVRTEVSGGVLRISCDKHFSASTPVRVRVSAPDIDGLDVSGASNVSLAGVKNSDLKVEVSGASKIRVDGATSELNVEASGASKVDTSALAAEACTVSTSGASNATVNAVSTLQADASGASHINYSGAPKNVVKKSSGASSINGQ